METGFDKSACWSLLSYFQKLGPEIFAQIIQEVGFHSGFEQLPEHPNPLGEVHGHPNQDVVDGTDGQRLVHPANQILALETRAVDLHNLAQNHAPEE